MRKNAEIERLRGVAILLVFITHTFAFQSLLPSAFRFGWVGVDLFFVISGYVVSLSLMRLLPSLSCASSLRSRLRDAKNSLKQFYLRRACRILPLVIFWMLAHLVLTYFFQSRAPEVVGTLGKVAKEDLLFCTGLFNYLRDNTAIQGQLWSLSVEEHFYLLLPLIFIVAPTRTRRLVATIVGIFLVAFVLRPYIRPFDGADLVSFQTYTSHRRFDTLYFGVLVALLFRAAPYRGALQSRSLEFRGKVLRSALAGLLVALLWVSPALVSEGVRLELGFTVYAMVATALVYLASKQEGYIFEIPGLSSILEYIGTRSYGLYLSHVPLSRLYSVLVEKHVTALPEFLSTSALGKITQGLALLLINLAVAELTYRYIEQPFIKKSHRRQPSDGNIADLSPAASTSS